MHESARSRRLPAIPRPVALGAVLCCLAAASPAVTASPDYRAADSLARLALPGLCARWATDSLAVQPALDAAFDVLAPHRPVVGDPLLGFALRSRDLHHHESGRGSVAGIRADVRVALLLDGAERWSEARALLVERWGAIVLLGRTDPVLLSDALYVLGRADHYLEGSSIARSDSALAASAELRTRVLGPADPR